VKFHTDLRVAMMLVLCVFVTLSVGRAALVRSVDTQSDVGRVEIGAQGNVNADFQDAGAPEVFEKIVKQHSDEQSMSELLFTALHGRAFLEEFRRRAPDEPLNIEEAQLSEVGDPELEDLGCSATQNDSLQFLHISKTAGSAIEKWGLAHGLHWGVYWKQCLKQSSPREFTETDVTAVSSYRVKLVVNLETQHAPPSWFQDDPYAGWDTFMVVRNPYTRVLSEFRCPWAGFCGVNSGIFCPVHAWRRSFMRMQADAQILNLWVRARLEEKLNRLGGHLIEQTEYLYDDGIRRETTTILRYENLTAEFGELMARYGYNSDELKDVNSVSLREMPEFSVDDLDQESRTVIEERFGSDFAEFDYAMMTSQ